MIDETLDPDDLGEGMTGDALPAQPPDPSDQPDLVGRVLDGRYRVEACLGRGGMGAVYRATQMGVTERTVAIKVILPQRAPDAATVARFRREAGAVARLTHPNSLRVFEFGETSDGVAYLVTELLRGTSLADELTRVGAMPVERALRIANQVLASLSEAHGLGIIHRDLKPDNLFLTDVVGSSDFVKVIDFGVATAPDADPTGRVTATGMAVGTPAYMAPEQAHGKIVGPAADLYAMAVILYEMVAGQRPFQGETPFDLMRAHVMDPPPPLDVPGVAIPTRLREVVGSCLEKDPAARPQGADVLRQELEAILRALSSPPAPAPLLEDTTGVEEAVPSDSGLKAMPDRPRVWPWLAGAAAIAVAVGAYVASGPGDDAQTPPSDRPVAVKPATPPKPEPRQPEPVAAVAVPVPRRDTEPWTAGNRRAPLAAIPVEIQSTPKGAAVRNDEWQPGSTPLTVYLPEGAVWRVDLRRKGFEPASVELHGVAAAEPVRVRLTPRAAALDIHEFDDDAKVLDKLGGK